MENCTNKPPDPFCHCDGCVKGMQDIDSRMAEKSKAFLASMDKLPDPPKPPPQPKAERSRVKFYRPSKKQGEGERMFDVHSFATTGVIECAFPSCTNTFKAKGNNQKYCGKPCRKKDGPFRRKREEFERAQARN